MSGRVAVVTDGASGIGAATAVALAEVGTDVVIGSFPGDPHDPAIIVAAVEAVGGHCVVQEVNVRSAAQVDALAQRAVNEFGRIDIAVANAGVLRAADLDNLDDDAWASVVDVDVDVTGVIRTFRSCDRHMGEGAMVAVSSIAGGVYGSGGHAHYGAAKTGVLGLSSSRDPGQCRRPRVDRDPAEPGRRQQLRTGGTRRCRSRDSVGPRRSTRGDRDRHPFPVLRSRLLPHRAGAGRRRWAHRTDANMTGGLESRTVLIVGGGSVIGAAIAAAFRDAGSTVTTADLIVDGTDEQPVRVMAEAAGSVDVLINSAGILTESPMVEMSLAQWQRTSDVDLTGVFLACRYVVPRMVERGWGRVVNIASQLGIKGRVGMTHYSAAKAGVLGFTKALAQEVAPHGVLVNAIAPGPIDTPLVAGMSDDWKTAKRAELPLGRFGTPDEVAPTAVLLASDPGGNLCVGQTLGPNSGDVMP